MTPLVRSPAVEPPCRNHRIGRMPVPRTSRTLAAATAATALIGVTGLSASAAPGTSGLTDAVKTAAIMGHLEQSQEFAGAGDGSRASGTSGYDASLAYVESKLEAAGYLTTRRTFTFNAIDELAPPVLERVSPSPRSYAEGDDFYTAESSGSGDVLAALRPVDVVVPPGAAASTS